MRLQERLIEIGSQIDMFEALGVDTLQSVFRFQYRTAGDVRVCVEHCLPLNGVIYSGASLLENFPYAEQLDALTWRANNVHVGTCRCELHCINAREACVALLWSQIQKS